MDLEAAEIRFSVVAPNLNEMPYLEDMFLRGLMSQSFKDFEVIIVDGGSKNEELKIMEKYKGALDLWVAYSDIRNFGYIRNLGCKYAEGEIIVTTNTDVYLPRDFLERVDRICRENPDLIALGGRVTPSGRGSSVLAHVAYGFFDLARYLMARVRRLRASGNFLAVYRDVFDETGGYPEVTTNEDGLYGYRLDEYLRDNPGKKVGYNLGLKVSHNVKTFEQKGAIGGILFYFYVVGLVFPFLQPLLKPIELKTGREFVTRSYMK